MQEWHTTDNCPICHKLFTGDLCPHSIKQAVERLHQLELEQEIKTQIQKLKRIEADQERVRIKEIVIDTLKELGVI